MKNGPKTKHEFKIVGKSKIIFATFQLASNIFHIKNFIYFFIIHFCEI
jgi:hypothetical protein